MRRIPRLCRRKDGRLYVTDPATGRQLKIASEDDYERFRSDFLARQTSPQPAPIRSTVAQLLDAYLTYAEGYYRKRGKTTSHLLAVYAACRAVRACWGDGRDASSIRGADVRALQEHLIGRGLARATINSYVGVARRAWRWGLSVDAVDHATVEKMRSVRDLQKGRSAAAEYPEIKPVSVEDLEATLAVLRPPADSMVRVQLHGGMRPGEVCVMRSMDIDRTQTPWLYRVHGDWDKTEHHKGRGDRPREVYLGPQARTVLEPLLNAARDPDAPLFHGRDGQRLTVWTYSHRIETACNQAGVPVWRPNQLRHKASTDIRKRYGLEGSRTYLGQEDLNVAAVYAEKDADLARRIAEESR